MRAILIPVEGDIRDVDLEPRDDDCLEAMREHIGEWVELVPLGDGIFAAFNEDGKWLDLPTNERATWLLYPYTRDTVVGNMLIVASDPETGEAIDLPAGVVVREAPIGHG